MLCIEMVSKEKPLCLVNVEALLTCSLLIFSPTPCGLLLPLDSPKMTLFRFVFLFGTFFLSPTYLKGTDLQLKKNQKGVKLFIKIIIRGTRYTFWPETKKKCQMYETMVSKALDTRKRCTVIPESGWPMNIVIHGTASC